jgi:phenylacetate-CoA ligase
LASIEAEKPMGQIVEQLNAMPGISSILTYPSTLAILTKEKEAGRLRIEPTLIKVSGETLTDELRERVRRAFPSLKYDILNAYASTECLLPSSACCQGRHHVHEDWVILEPVDEAMEPVPDGDLSNSALLTVLANEVQPIIRYVLGDRLRFFADPCPCGSPFRSFEVEGRRATLVRVGKVTLSPLAFDLEHERARRVQLVQTGEGEFELRMELAEGAEARPVFEEVIESARRVFRENGLDDVVIRESRTPPEFTASGKFHEVLPLKTRRPEGNPKP